MSSRRVTLPAVLGRESVCQLLEALEAAQRDPSVRAITLEGSGEAFCRGLDLAGLVHESPGEGIGVSQSSGLSERRDNRVSGYLGVEEPPALSRVTRSCQPLDSGPTARRSGGPGLIRSGEGPARRRTALQDFARVLLSLRSAPKPTIALVDGSASGGGVGLAAACDLVICTERASFAFPEVLFGLVPAMVLPLVLERMSPQRARLWALTGLAHGPEEALAAGLADVVIPSAALERELKRWLRKLARGHVRGVAELKRLTETLPLSLEQAIERGLQLTASALDDEAVLSAVRSFLDDGTPPWED